MSKLSSVIGQYINKYKMMKPKELSALAEKGDAEAMYELGKKLYSGKGVSKSYEEAREMFEKGAEAGHVGCCYELGAMLVGGIGGETDDERAAELFRKAADGGDVHAMFELGAMYAQGRGVKKSYVKAMRYLRMANALPEANAMLDEAISWWRPAAEARIPEGEYWYGVCLINGYGVTPDYTTGFNWIYQAALSDHPKAIDAMVQIYEGGIGVPEDKGKAAFWRDRYKKVVGAKAGKSQGIFDMPSAPAEEGK
mgnify:FL=1